MRRAPGLSKAPSGKLLWRKHVEIHPCSGFHSRGPSASTTSMLPAVMQQRHGAAVWDSPSNLARHHEPPPPLYFPSTRMPVWIHIFPLVVLHSAWRSNMFPPASGACLASTTMLATVLAHSASTASVPSNRGAHIHCRQVAPSQFPLRPSLASISLHSSALWRVFAGSVWHCSRRVLR